MKIILTGATGMVGEGVLLACLQDDIIKEILVLTRRAISVQHPKLKQLIVRDFMQIQDFKTQLADYDACFYCAGISSVGLKEDAYSKITFDTTLHVAKVLSSINSDMVFNFVTGTHTDSSEQGKVMWARVKGKTENALMRLPFRGQYNFRPGFMKPLKGQTNVRWFFKPIIAIFPHLFPNKSLTLSEVARAMINTVTKGYPTSILEIADIKKLAAY